MESLVELRNIHVTLRGREVLRDVSLTVQQGERVVVRGSNGAGKTTLCRVLANVLQPTSGKRTLPAAISFISQSLGLFPSLTVQQNLSLFAKPNSDHVDSFGLGDVLDDRVAYLSRGVQSRVAIVRALACASQFLVLDEIDSSLDDAGRQQLLQVLRQETRAWVVVTHREDFLNDARTIMVRDGGTI